MDDPLTKQEPSSPSTDGGAQPPLPTIDVTLLGDEAGPASPSDTALPITSPSSDVVFEPIGTEGVMTGDVAPTLSPSPLPLELPTIEVDPNPVSTAETSPVPPSASSPDAEKIVERVVEKIVEKEVIKEVPVERIIEKEVIKEVPVEKIVEKIVYRDRAPLVCPPPTEEEKKAILHEFLVAQSQEGTSKKRALMEEKKRKILALFDGHERITRHDVTRLLVSSASGAGRLLSQLVQEGKIQRLGVRSGTYYIKAHEVVDIMQIHKN